MTKTTIACEINFVCEEDDKVPATEWVRAEQVSCSCAADRAVCKECFRVVMERFTCPGCGR